MSCYYEFIEIGRSIWDNHWDEVQHAPMLQSWEYGDAKCRAQHLSARRFLLKDMHATPVGLMQVLVYTLPLVGGIARINRGPVFFSAEQRVELRSDALKPLFQALLETCKRYRWCVVKMAPELLAGESEFDHTSFQQMGFKLHTSSHASAVIDISRTSEIIRAGFHSKWRNLLNKSEKGDLELDTPSVEVGVEYLVSKYEEMQKEKGFSGIPSQLLRAMSEQRGPLWNCRILFATHLGERCGAVMVVGHGDTCTYIVGWTSEVGRQFQANYFLLWYAILHFKEMGYRYFDVGGLGENTTAGVGHFKRRLGGNYYSLIGEMSYSTIPFLTKFIS